MAYQALAYAPQLGLGLLQSINSYSRIQDLKKEPLAKYNLQPAQQNVNMYDTRFRQGLSPEELGGMKQQFASEQAGMYRQASEASGGQLSSFLGRVSGFDRIRQASQLGSMMASERRAAMSGLAGARQSLEAQMNRQTSQDISRRMSEEQALGGALKTSTENLGNSLTMGLDRLMIKQEDYDDAQKSNLKAPGNEQTNNYDYTRNNYQYTAPQQRASIFNMGMGINDPLYMKPSRFKTPKLSFR